MLHLFNRCSTVVTLLLLVAFLAIAQGTRITVLHVNDTHSHLDAFGPKNHAMTGEIGGIAKAATIIGGVRAHHKNVLLLHAGDAFVGDFMFNEYFGVPELQLLQQLGVDAMAVGNHEFDFGPDFLAMILGQAFPQQAFPLLSANLDMTAVPALQQFIQPAIMKDIGGVKVGIFGMTVPAEPTSNAAPVIINSDIGTIAGTQVAMLRQQGAQVVIMLSHLGNYLDRIIASNVPGIDVIVGGHDHYVFERPQRVKNPAGTNTLILEAGHAYEYVGKLEMEVGAQGVRVMSYELVPVDKHVPRDPTVQGFVDQLKAGIMGAYGDVYRKVVAEAVMDLDQEFDAARPWRDTPLGDLVTDAYRHTTHSDIAVTAIGLTGEKIYAGPIVGNDVFHVLCYGYDQASGLGFTLATGTIDAANLVKGLEIGVSELEVTQDFVIQVSGMEYAYDAGKPAGERVNLASIRIHGRPLDPARSYTITTNSGIIGLLSVLGVTIGNVQIRPDLEYNVLRDHLHELRVVRPCTEHRIVDTGVRPFAHRPSGEAGIASGRLNNRCYPNPFNPTTTIAFDLTKAGHVSLRVYNLIGQEVANLVNEDLPAGTYHRTFDASRLSSGTYFYRLEADGHIDVAKMALLK